MKSFKEHLKEGIERMARLAGAVDKKPEDQSLIDALNRATAKLQRRQFNQSPASWDRSHLAFQTKLRFGKINKELLDRHYNDLMQDGMRNIIVDDLVTGIPTPHTMMDIFRSFHSNLPLLPKKPVLKWPPTSAKAHRRRNPPPESF